MYVIDELEAQLREKDRALQNIQLQQVSVNGIGDPEQASSGPADFTGLPKFVQSDVDLVNQPLIGDASVFTQYPGPPGSSGSSVDYATYPSTGAIDGVAPVADIFNERSVQTNHAVPSSPILNSTGLSPVSIDSYMELRSWPPNLPTPDVTRHL